MVNENQVHLNCFNPRTNGTLISTNEIVRCIIRTDVMATVDDFAVPPSMSFHSAQ